MIEKRPAICGDCTSCDGTGGFHAFCPQRDEFFAAWAMTEERKADGGGPMKCDRRIGMICVYLQRECPYAPDREEECPNFWKIEEAGQ